MKRWLLACAALLGTPTLAQDDLLCLKDGRVFADLSMERTDGGVTIHFENGDVAVPGGLILDALVAGSSSFEPTNDEEREKLAKGFVPFDGKWVSQKRRDQLIAKRLKERREAIEEMQAHREWRNRYREESKNFAFEFTVPKHIFDGYRESMEAYFSIFAKDWKVKRPRDRPKLSVCFYGSRKEFHRTGGAGSYVLGYFKFHPEFDLNIYYDRLDPAETEDVMFHEANHYLQKLIDVDFSYPHWPGEALAEYYGASAWDPDSGKLTTGLIQEGRLIEIQNDIAGGKMLGLAELILDERAYEHYTWGWSLVHFLMNDKRHAKKFQKFFVALAKGKDVRREDRGMGLKTVRGPEVWRAFRDYLGLRDDEDVVELQQKWHAYVQDKLELTSARGLEKAALSALRTGRDLRAQRLFEEAIAAGSSSALTYHKYAGLLRNKGKREAAVANWRRAIELDPLAGSYYYALGRALASKDKDESARLKALGLEIDPEAASEWWWD
ncbi:MAG: hypothetical protein AAF682_13975 [Planctomycetota bacterium]